MFDNNPLNVVRPLIAKKRQDFVKPSHQQNDFALRYIILLMVAVSNIVNKTCSAIWDRTTCASSKNH